MNSKNRMLYPTLAAALAATALQAAPQNDRPEPGNQTKQVGQDKNQRAHLLRASKLIGLDIHDAKGEDLGEVNNLVIDPSCACARIAIVSYGGALGVGDSKVAVPIKALRIASDGSKATLDITKERLSQAPKFDENNWDVVVDKNWNQTVHQYFNVKSDGEFQDSTKGPDNKALKPLKGSEVVGMDVRNRQDEDLGEIEDLMIDVNSGRIGYAVLSYGGVLGVNEKLFAVPWQSLTVTPQGDQIVLGVEKDKLANAPGFDKNDWPDMNDLNWSKDVHAFYGSDPNWIYGYSPAEGSRDSGARAGDKSGWDAQSEYNRKFNNASVQTYKGAITDISSDEPMDGMSDAAVLTLRGDQGQEMAVHLGPNWFIENQDHQFKENDQVEITGCQVDLNGKKVIMASEVKRGGDVLRLRDKNGRPLWAAWHKADESSSGGMKSR